MEEYMPTEEWGKEFEIDKLWINIEANLKVFAPKVLEAIDELSDEDSKDLQRCIIIMLRQWYMDNTVD